MTNNIDYLNYLDQAEGLPVSGFANTNPQAQIAQQRMRALAVPFALPDNSNIIGVGQNSQAQALGMMNTPGVGQPQVAKGLVGRYVDKVWDDKTNQIAGNTESKFSFNQPPTVNQPPAKADVIQSHVNYLNSQKNNSNQGNFWQSNPDLSA